MISSKIETGSERLSLAIEDANINDQKCILDNELKKLKGLNFLESSLLIEEEEQQTTKNSKKLALIPLIFLIYFEVAGGPYGEEAAVGAAGPLLAILGFLIFPFIWSIPEALVTAELETTFPGNGGFVIWAHKAFGPFWGSLMGSWKLLSGVINLASYPVICVDYLKQVLPVFSSGFPRYLAILFSTLFLSFLNYTGLTVVGEVDQPQKTYPIALFSAGIFTCLSYLIPLLAATGATSLDQEKWVDGYFADLAAMIAGKWLKYWVEIGAVLSVIGLYEAQLSSCAYQILCMANIGVVPRFFGVRSKWFSTPWVGILISTMIALAVSYLTFADIISSVNFFYSLGMLVEFASFLWLRSLVYVMVVATKTVYIVGALLTLFGIIWYFLMKLCKLKMWIEFDNAGEKDADEAADEDESFKLCLVVQLNCSELELSPICSLPINWETTIVSISNLAPKGILTMAIAKEALMNEELRRKEQGIESEY
ncbi:hypothetical protein ACH5RR_021661 [Cinchona calisaya]|uniref:Polyamine transporter n=1 Tax=Cinchona calisaya TaxID=153742 RepID=A0ABD2ZHZ1_9GENT